MQARSAPVDTGSALTAKGKHAGVISRLREQKKIAGPDALEPMESSCQSRWQVSG
jgi:hypothetical protein